MRIVVGLTGASGIVYGIRLLEVLKEKSVETHLVMTTAARKTIELETDYEPSYVESLASRKYSYMDISAPIASGTFKTDGMVVVPCSMKTLVGIAYGYEENLVIRSALVTLKEGRKVVLVPRETPLTIPYLRAMLAAAEAGATILPAMPAFYVRPRTIDDLVNFMVGRILDILGIEHELYQRWGSRSP